MAKISQNLTQINSRLNIIKKTQKTIPSILEAVDSYNSERDAVFLLEYEKQVAFCYLTNLPITSLPITSPQCFQTVCKQLVEF